MYQIFYSYLHQSHFTKKRNALLILNVFNNKEHCLYKKKIYYFVFLNKKFTIFCLYK